MKTGPAPMRARYISRAGFIRVQPDAPKPLGRCVICGKRLRPTQKDTTVTCGPACYKFHKEGRQRVAPMRLDCQGATERRLALGLCANCKNKREDLGKNLCSACRGKARALRQKRKAEKAAAEESAA